MSYWAFLSLPAEYWLPQLGVFSGAALGMGILPETTCETTIASAGRFVLTAASVAL